MELGNWLQRHSPATRGWKPYLGELGMRLLAFGFMMILIVGLAHADKKNAPVEGGGTDLVLPLLTGGVVGIVGALLWYVGDRKGRPADPTPRLPPVDEEGVTPSPGPHSSGGV
jgi:hypothetical protein